MSHHRPIRYLDGAGELKRMQTVVWHLAGAFYHPKSFPHYGSTKKTFRNVSEILNEFKMFGVETLAENGRKALIRIENEVELMNLKDPALQTQDFLGFCKRIGDVLNAFACSFRVVRQGVVVEPLERTLSNIRNFPPT